MMFRADSELITLRDDRLAEIMVAHAVEMMGKLSESLGHDVKIIGKPGKPISYHVERFDEAHEDDRGTVVIKSEDSRPWSVIN